ncbi:hypothetical protein CCUS01_11650 [Colletotrichum cuscutae]|uniref:DUF7053 domain-containing protein n=1 Tax=Colletotrichum cuscutae TaxID=1209917 RepID=A0AAI9XFS8_9PEZI|nr:hypothetical protein CCUS01_11650 [Colletotrichum cuscutae]
MSVVGKPSDETKDVLAARAPFHTFYTTNHLSLESLPYLSSLLTVPREETWFIIEDKVYLLLLRPRPRDKERRRGPETPIPADPEPDREASWLRYRSFWGARQTTLPLCATFPIAVTTSDCSSIPSRRRFTSSRCSTELFNEVTSRREPPVAYGSGPAIVIVIDIRGVYHHHHHQTNGTSEPTTPTPDHLHQKNLTIRIPLPSILPPEAVIETLQSQSPVIRHQPLVTRYEKVPVPLASVVSDAHFLEDGSRLACYKVYEKVTVVPGVKKEISFPAVLQNIPNGLRSRAEAPGGVRVWSEWLVVPRPEERWPGEHGGKLEGYVQGDYDLVETTRGQMEGAHRDMVQKVLDELGPPPVSDIGKDGEEDGEGLAFIWFAFQQKKQGIGRWLKGGNRVDAENLHLHKNKGNIAAREFSNGVDELAGADLALLQLLQPDNDALEAAAPLVLDDADGLQLALGQQPAADFPKLFAEFVVFRYGVPLACKMTGR